ncbi:MAG: selenide, water dikinase SelD [Candidatus Limnocylindrales bacterium]
MLDASTPFRLTDLTDCGGCAAKLGADLLADALSGLGADAAADPDPALIAGLTPPDDAAVYRVSDDLAIIGTLDFFPPLVDDPRTFGEIAAANALSDVFAMGGRVLFALSIAAFPEELPRDVLAAIFEGASSKVREAGGTLAGGHTIRDPEPKYGLAVMGAAHPDRLLRKGGARPGDLLLLTKRLGHRVDRQRPASGQSRQRGPVRRDRPDAHAQPGRLRGARGARRPGRDRRHRFRPAGARPGDGPGVRHALRVRGGRAARTPRGAGPGRRPAWRPAARPTTAATSCPRSRSPPGSRRNS